MRRVYIKAILDFYLLLILLLIFHTCGEAMCLCRPVDFGLYINWKKNYQALKVSQASSPLEFSELFYKIFTLSHCSQILCEI